MIYFENNASKWPIAAKKKKNAQKNGAQFKLQELINGAHNNNNFENHIDNNSLDNNWAHK